MSLVQDLMHDMQSLKDDMQSIKDENKDIRKQLEDVSFNKVIIVKTIAQTNWWF